MKALVALAAVLVLAAAASAGPGDAASNAVGQRFDHAKHAYKAVGSAALIGAAAVALAVLLARRKR